LKPAKVLLSGASGMIGSALGKALSFESITTARLVRDNADPERGLVRWNPPATAPEARFSPIPALFLPLDAAIHLSGASVAAKRWTPAYRRELRESRVVPTAALCDLLITLPQPPRVLVCASAIGIYGDRGSEMLSEESGPGKGFLADLCQEWEAAAKPAEQAGIRIVHLRFGMVLGRSGGVLAKLVPVFKLGLGGKLGSGEQWMSWVSLPDVTRAILFAIESEELRGAVNVVSPHPVTNTDFTRALGSVLRRPTVFAVPAAALRLAFGEMADGTMLASTRALPMRLSDAGFRFEHERIEPALQSLLAG
jgi:uncharacterized protein